MGSEVLRPNPMGEFVYYWDEVFAVGDRDFIHQVLVDEMERSLKAERESRLREIDARLKRATKQGSSSMVDSSGDIYEQGRGIVRKANVVAYAYLVLGKGFEPHDADHLIECFECDRTIDQPPEAACGCPENHHPKEESRG